MKTIATIVPLYNGANYIAEAVQSILDQDRKSDEIVIVDDGSTDSGLGVQIVQELQRKDPRIRILHQENAGQGSARNFGIRSTSSELIALLDQDDIWYPQHLAELEKPFLEDKETSLGWVYSNVDRIDADGRLACPRYLDTLNTREHPKRTLINCLRENMMILPGGSVIAREAFDRVGGFDDRLAGYEDDDLFLRMFCAGYRNIYINQSLTKWRIHSASTSFTIRMARSRGLYFETLVARFPDQPATGRFHIRDAVAPRFARNTLRDLIKSIKREQPDAAALANSQLKRLASFLPWWKRWSYTFAARIVTRRIVATAIISLVPTWTFLRKFRPQSRFTWK